MGQHLKHLQTERVEFQGAGGSIKSGGKEKLRVKTHQMLLHLSEGGRIFVAQGFRFVKPFLAFQFFSNFVFRQVPGTYPCVGPGTRVPRYPAQGHAVAHATPRNGTNQQKPLILHLAT